LGGFANFLYGKILGGIFRFFLKNPSKLKNFWVKGGDISPNPLSGYALWDTLMAHGIVVDVALIIAASITSK